MISMFDKLVARSLPIVPKTIVGWTAKRYVAGSTVDDAIATVKTLNAAKIVATIDCLGEFVTERQQAEHAAHMSHDILDAIAKHELQSGLSVKLTSLGLDIDDEFCYTNLRQLVEKAQKMGRFVRIDMENSPYTTRTLALYHRLLKDGFTNTGVVLQAYMRRTQQDIRDLASTKTSVRLCKGIYREDKSIAFQGREEVQDNFKASLLQLFDNGMFAAIATHDDVLLDFARDQIRKKKLPKDRYEFQMLLGVRENKRDELVAEGHRVRIYVPFGKDWYGYCVRRLRENPQIATHVLKAIFTGGA